MVLNAIDVREKLGCLDSTLQQLLVGHSFPVPDQPGRDVPVYCLHRLPGRMALSTAVGRQKLLHDLANIELQAMELGLRTLIEFPDAHPDLREQLAQIVREEAKHLQMCLQSLETLGGHWGQWPVHLGLWDATHGKDSLLERLFIVHRYLEGSGLDSGDSLLRRLSGVSCKVVKQTVKTIVDEEVGHVLFGSRWFAHYTKQQNVDSFKFFDRLTQKLLVRHPRKDKVSVSLRQAAGFSELEIENLQKNKQRLSLR